MEANSTTWLNELIELEKQIESYFKRTDVTRNQRYDKLHIFRRSLVSLDCIFFPANCFACDTLWEKRLEVADKLNITV